MRMATTRTRRTPEQRAAFHEAKAAKARKEAQATARTLETRRKVIAGGALLAMAENDDKLAVVMLQRITGGLKRPHDRAAFGLPPLVAPSASAVSSGTRPLEGSGAPIQDRSAPETAPVRPLSTS